MAQGDAVTVVVGGYRLNRGIYTSRALMQTGRNSTVTLENKIEDNCQEFGSIAWALVSNLVTCRLTASDPCDGTVRGQRQWTFGSPRVDQ